jgi:hypothetical protein
MADRRRLGDRISRSQPHPPTSITEITINRPSGCRMGLLRQRLEAPAPRRSAGRLRIGERGALAAGGHRLLPSQMKAEAPTKAARIASEIHPS